MPTLTHSRLLELLSYEPETGQFYWRVRRGPNADAGSLAGRLGDDGYRKICIDRQTYRAGRLAWFYVNGTWPLNDIDHIDGDCLNDRIANLRPATHSQNQANRGPQANNTSGFKGVCRWRGNRWQAGVGYQGKRIYIGIFDSPEAAHAAYVAKYSELFGPFARAA